jgi:hypothetical protein
MSKTLTIEIYVDDPRTGEFKSAAKSVYHLQAFLKKLDGTEEPWQGYAEASSDGIPPSFPVKQTIIVYCPDQARAIGYILYGWTLLNALKRVVIRGTTAMVEITHETSDVDEAVSSLGPF